MKRTAIIFAILLALCLYAKFGSAEGFAIGGTKLSGAEIDIDFGKQVVTAKGNAGLNAPNTSIKAESIRLELQRGKDGKLSLLKSTASGGVIIHARQIDRGGKSSIVDATSKTASMAQGEDTVVLSGDVKMKVTNADLAEPAVLSGERIIVYLKENRIQAQRSADNPAELTVTPKEASKQ